MSKAQQIYSKAGLPHLIRQNGTVTRQDFEWFTENYADRTLGMSVSAVRALFAVANRPEVVSLAGGMPNIADLPRAEIAATIQNLIAEKGIQAMQYGSGQGEAFMREAICPVMEVEGIKANPDNIVVTCGSQQALDIITRIFCNPGDVVLLESPSYVGAISTFNSYQVDLRHVPMDADGIIPEALTEIVKAIRAEGKTIKFLYTIPNFQNPTGATMPLARRQALIVAAEKLDLVIVEDNPYGLLTLTGETLPTLRSLDDQRVIYLGSFSKTFAPGFRIGWMLAPYPVREKAVLAQESATLCPPVFSQFAVSRYLNDFDWLGQVKVFRKMYLARRDAMEQGLKEYMPEGVTWNTPTGGFFYWLTLPEGLDSEAMLPRAINAKVAYVIGSAFYADGQGQRNIRLSYCFPPSERIIEGCRRLGEVINEELEMLHTFSSGISLQQRKSQRRQTNNPAPNTL